jgi:hypothetical protein
MNVIKNIDWEKVLYNSGDVFLPKPIKEFLDKSLYMTKNHSFYINGWTFVHYFSGILVGAIYLYFNKPIQWYYIYLLILHTIWELWQVFIGMAKPWKLTGHSNLIDSFVDTIVFMLGAYVTFQIYSYTISIKDNKCDSCEK